MVEKTVDKGIAIILVFILLPVALLVLGQLGTGAGSFWYGINNPNVTGASGAVNLLETTVIPIMVAVALFVVVLLGALKIVKV
jgi:hypothetical protein